MPIAPFECECCSGAVCCPDNPCWYVTLNGTVGPGAIDTQGCDTVPDGSTWTPLCLYEYVYDEGDVIGKIWGLPWDNPAVPTVGYISCDGFGQAGGVLARLACVNGVYQVSLETTDSIGLAGYVYTGEEWDCDGCNVLDFSNQAPDGRCCDFSETTLTVCPLSSSSSSGPGGGPGMGVADFTDLYAPSSSSPRLRPTTPRPKGKCCGKRISSTSPADPTVWQPPLSS